MPLPPGYIIGHEPMGIVEEVGPEVTKVKRETVLSFPLMFHVDIAFIANMKWKANVITQTLIMILADTLVILRSSVTIRVVAEYLKVPFGNFTPFVIPESCELEDESLLFLSDVLPTAYWSVKMQV